MAHHNLTTASLTRRVLNATAAGSTDITTATTVDTLGYEGARFIAACGTITNTAVAGLKLQASSDDAAADDYTDIAGTLTSFATTTAGNNAIVIVDIYRPKKRYLKAIVTRATANIVIDGVWCELYHAQQKSVAKHSTVTAQTVLTNPAEGTA